MFDRGGGGKPEFIKVTHLVVGEEQECHAFTTSLVLDLRCHELDDVLVLHQKSMCSYLSLSRLSLFRDLEQHLLLQDRGGGKQGAVEADEKRLTYAYQCIVGAVFGDQVHIGKTLGSNCF